MKKNFGNNFGNTRCSLLKFIQGSFVKFQITLSERAEVHTYCAYLCNALSMHTYSTHVFKSRPMHCSKFA